MLERVYGYYLGNIQKKEMMKKALLTVITTIVLLLLASPLSSQASTSVGAHSKAPQYFQSPEEAQLWLDSNTIRINLTVDENLTPVWDCDDYAESLENRALADGFIITQVAVMNGRIWNKYVSRSYGAHVGNWTKINNAYYYIESSPIKGYRKLIKIANAD